MMERSTNFFLKIHIYVRSSIWPNYRYVLHAKMNENLILPITDQTSSFDSENIIKKLGSYSKFLFRYFFNIFEKDIVLDK